jgi:DNA polymerase-3 subunit alpha
VFYGPGGRQASQYDVANKGAYLHLTVLAVNQAGLKNLFALSSASHDPSRVYSKPRIDFELLEQHSEGLVILTGCPSSEISTRFLLGQDDKAYEYAGRLKEVFGSERLFVEVMEHGMKIDLERKLLPKQVKLGKDLGLKLVATNDSHYALRENAIHHEEMLCSQSGSRMADKTWDAGGDRFAFDGAEYYLKSGAEMLEKFPERDFPGVVTNSLIIAEMAKDIRLDFDAHLKPNPVLPEGIDLVTYFKQEINKGFKWRYGNASPEVREEAKKRNAYEFKIINSSDFIGYMVTVYHYIRHTRDKYATRDASGNILALPIGAGRGSVGGSVIAYELGISEVCPIKHDLIFERFLSDGRGATYRITYDGGPCEEVIVSTERSVQTADDKVESKYIHQLKVGDKVV